MTRKVYKQHLHYIVCARENCWARCDLIGYEIAWARFDLLRAYAQRWGWWL